MQGQLTARWPWLRVALLKAQVTGLGAWRGGATCTPMFLPLFPLHSLACRASLLAAPPRGELSEFRCRHLTG